MVKGRAWTKEIIVRPSELIALMKEVMEHRYVDQCQSSAVTFCTFLLYFCAPTSTRVSFKFSNVLWYVFCGFS
jgi:hypothetical protein